MYSLCEMSDMALYKCINAAVSDAIKDNLVNDTHYILIERRETDTLIIGVYNNKYDANNKQKVIKNKTEVIKIDNKTEIAV